MHNFKSLFFAATLLVTAAAANSDVRGTGWTLEQRMSPNALAWIAQHFGGQSRSFGTITDTAGANV